MNKIQRDSLKILYVVPGDKNGSSMIFAHNEISRIALTGVKTNTFLFGTPTNPIHVYRTAVRLRQTINEYKPDLLHAHFGTITAFICAIVSRSPLIITFRGSDLNPSPTDGWFRNRLQKILSYIAAYFSSANICVSVQLKERLWWCARKTIVIPTGVDLEVFKPVEQSVARKHLNWRNDERVVLFNAGRTPLVKRLDLAQAAVDIMQQQGGDVRFVVMDGDMPQQELPMLMSAANCLLMASDHEGSPDIIKEANACNLPVVSVEVGDVAERLHGVIPSRIVNRNPLEIASAIEEIIGLHQRSNGREYIQDLSTDTICKRIIETYDRILFWDSQNRRYQQ